MPRLFVALTLPELLAQQIALVQGGIPGARWEAAEKLHMTLRFIGEVEGEDVDAVTQALGRVKARAFELVLAGVGHFPPRGEPRALWIGVREPGPVVDLQGRIEAELRRSGSEPETRKFVPHVTLARLQRTSSRKVADFLGHHALFEAPPFTVADFALMSSVLGPAGSKYRVEQRFGLGG